MLHSCVSFKVCMELSYYYEFSNLALDKLLTRTEVAPRHDACRHLLLVAGKRCCATGKITAGQNRETENHACLTHIELSIRQPVIMLLLAGDRHQLLNLDGGILFLSVTNVCVTFFVL